MILHPCVFPHMAAVNPVGLGGAAEASTGLSISACKTPVSHPGMELEEDGEEEEEEEEEEEAARSDPGSIVRLLPDMYSPISHTKPLRGAPRP